MTDKLLRPARLLILGLAALLAACASKPEPRAEAIVSAAHPLAVQAGEEILRQGGSATDAIIATMAALGLVEPQSAGLGGGGFLLTWTPASRDLDAFDGREIAPAAASENLFIDPATGRPYPFPQAVASGLSTGAPALIPMLEMAHREHGRLPWAQLFAPAIRIAEEGFPVTPRLHRWVSALVQRGGLADDPAARAYLLTPDGQPKPVGAIIRNPEYAATLRAIAANGARAMTHGAIAEQIVDAVNNEPRPGALSLDDLAAVRPRRLDALCGTFRVYRVCSMPPPSSGGVAVLATLGLYERARPHPEGAQSIDDWAAFMWASRLSYADRDYYLGDDQFVPVPTQGLIAPAYLDDRARQIDLSRPPAGLTPGDPSRFAGGQSLLGHWGQDATDETPGTTHLVAMDAQGNVASLTATIESVFGSQRMAAGFFLNNQLTDFSLAPTRNGLPVANAPGPRKRPRSSMAPTIIFDANGDFKMAIGSPGGSSIIGYVSRAVIATLDWNMPLQDAVAQGNVVARGRPARIEPDRLPPGVVDGLSARGWIMQPMVSEDSGLHAILATPHGYEAAADPRREGVVGRAR